MSEDKQPVTDAVRDAYAQKKSVNWAMDIWGADPEKPHLNRKVVEVVGSVLLGHSFRTVSGDGRGQPCDPADAASALRLVADALSRDPTRRALEIAARLGEASYVLAHCDNNIISARLGRLCQRFGHVVDEHLSAAETQSTIAMINKLSGVVSARFVGSGDDGWKHSWILDALQQARDFFEQAEKEAAEPEELVLTDDMLERMRKRCIHGR